MTQQKERGRGEAAMRTCDEAGWGREAGGEGRQQLFTAESFIDKSAVV